MIKIPQAFTKCVRNGGKVRTKDLGNGKYMHICYDKNGNSHAGEILTRKKSKKKEKSKEKNSKQLVSNAKATLDDLQRLKDFFDHHYKN